MINFLFYLSRAISKSVFMLGYCVVGLLVVTQPVVAQESPAGGTKGGQNRRCSDPMLYGAKDTGDTIEGPVCVGVKINALRYGGQLGRTVTVSAGPNLPGGLTPPSALTGATPASAPLHTAVAPQPDTLIAIQQDFTATRSLFYDQREVGNIASEGMVAQAATALKNLVLGSDDVFNAGGGTSVLMRANDPLFQQPIQAALLQKWTTSDDVYIALHNLQGRLQSFSFANPSATDAQKTQITLLQSSITAMLTDVTPTRTGGDRANAFNKQLSIVAAWDTLIKSLTEDSFTLESYVGCGTLFNQNRQIAVRILQTDRLPSFDGSALSQTDLKDPFVTLTCASPFVVSAGVEFSFLSTNTFGIVPSGTTGSNQFGITDSSKTNPMPIGMVHVRIHDWSDHKIGLFGSFGVAAHVQGSGSGGSSAEFLTGLSVGLFRGIFLTPGWHVGKVSALNGGYKVGDPVPTGVTVVPTTSSYQSGFGLAVTFTKP